MRPLLIATVATLVLTPVLSLAATRESFQLRTAQDLVDLCAVPEGDPMVEAARSFCYGYLNGAGDYHRATHLSARDKPLICLPEQRPTRAEAAQWFVDWAKAHPESMQEAAIDALFRFATAKWPCPEKKPR